jgi:hypothetical protein
MYTPDARGCHDDRFGSRIVKELPNSALLGQIKLDVRTNDEVAKPVVLERSNHRRAHQAAVTSDVNPGTLSQFHASLLVVAVNLETFFGHKRVALGYF